MKLRLKLGINANLLIFSVVKFAKSIYFALPKFYTYMCYSYVQIDAQLIQLWEQKYLCLCGLGVA